MTDPVPNGKVRNDDEFQGQSSCRDGTRAGTKPRVMTSGALEYEERGSSELAKLVRWLAPFVLSGCALN